MSRTGDTGWKTETEASWRDAGYFPQGFLDVQDVAYMLGSDRNGLPHSGHHSHSQFPSFWLRRKTLGLPNRPYVTRNNQTFSDLTRFALWQICGKNQVEGGLVNL